MPHREEKIINWVIYLKCPKCGKFKPATEEFWRKGTKWVAYLGLKSPCGECMRKDAIEYRKKIADTPQWDRNRAYTIKKNKERREKNYDKVKDYNKNRARKANIEARARKRAKRLGVIPKICPICWWGWRITLHHQDYNKRREVVPCCMCCHRRIHAWRDVDVSKTIDLKKEIEEQQYFRGIYGPKKVFDKADEWTLFYNRTK